jgi:phosphatidylserine/phosphatidylglycerophosphate/cardiolipin synthase-like enzyme
MSGRAFAIANNDIVHIAWSFDAKLPGCTGVRIYRLPDGSTGSGTPLKSLVAFEERSNPPSGAAEGAALPDEPVNPVAPPALIKGFRWRDLLSPAARGVKVRYRIVAMQGREADATPLPNVPELMTRWVTPTPHMGAVDAYFNRGILSTQALARTLKPYGGTSVTALRKALDDTKGTVRGRLTGELQDAVLSLLARRKSEGGECYAALYELTDDLLITRLEAAGKKLHLVLSNNTGDDKTVYDGANHAARQRLAKTAGELLSRYMPESRSIGHNKFMVYVDSHGKPQAVLTGSTNWTGSGLCTQNNNAIIVRSPELAKRYLDYWKALKLDTTTAKIPAKAAPVSALQGAVLRTADAVKPTSMQLTGAGGRASVWPSPNTAGVIPRHKTGDPPPATPPDLAEVFAAIQAARQAVLVLVFQPGSSVSEFSWTIIKELSRVGKAKPGLYIRGAISDEAEALQFEAAREAAMDAEMVAPAGIMKDTKRWVREIYKAGHAIVHDKIIVIDPFSPDCVVVTGSHNLGFKASYNNDENLLIIRGNRPLAEAYAAHIADIIEHYRWRWYNKREAQRKAASAWVKDGSDPATALDEKYDPNVFYDADIPADDGGDGWQDRYFDPSRLASLERQFWLGDGTPLPPRAPGPFGGFNSGLTKAELAFRKAVADLMAAKKKKTKKKKVAGLH